MECTIRLNDKRIYDEVLRFLESIGVDAKAQQPKVKRKLHDLAFGAMKLHTKGFRFDRNEANAR